MQLHLFPEILAVPFVAGAYTWLRGHGIFKDGHQESPRLDSLLVSADAYAAVIVIVFALVCAVAALE